jgi:hypothetical protein
VACYAKGGSWKGLYATIRRLLYLALHFILFSDHCRQRASGYFKAVFLKQTRSDISVDCNDFEAGFLIAYRKI